MMTAQHRFLVLAIAIAAANCMMYYRPIVSSFLALSNKSRISDSPSIIHRFQHVEKELVSRERRYFVYNEEQLTFESDRKVRKSIYMSRDISCRGNSYCADSMQEQAVLNALFSHPWRHTGKNVTGIASSLIYIIPTPFIALAGSGCKSADQFKHCERHTLRDDTVFDSSLNFLTQHSLFTGLQGHRHVMIPVRWTLTASNFGKMMVKWYPRLENVTLADYKDRYASQYLANQNPSYAKTWTPYSNVTRSMFVVGQGIEDLFPLQRASLQRFQQSRFFLFYRTRPRGSQHNSTIFRHAPLHLDQELLAPSSIGNDLPFAVWKEHLLGARFCLIIRGDDPTSHALLRTLRAGCIPVVISDFFQEIGGPLPLTLHMNDFCIFIPEEEFISDPLDSLLKLRSLPDPELQSKIAGVNFAQQVMFPEHPNSLFVPAFLREAESAMNKYGVD